MSWAKYKDYQPTDKQVQEMRDEWYRVKGDYWNLGDEFETYVNNIDDAINTKRWADAIMYLSEIGADECVLKLLGKSKE